MSDLNHAAYPGKATAFSRISADYNRVIGEAPVSLLYFIFFILLH